VYTQKVVRFPLRLFGAWRSLVARLNGVQKVARSNRVAPIKKTLRFLKRRVFLCLSLALRGGAPAREPS
jgi:hypothetical protein